MPIITFLLLIVTDGLSILLRKVEENQEIQGTNINSLIKILILLFVDDIVIFGKGNLKEWESFQQGYWYDNK